MVLTFLKLLLMEKRKKKIIILGHWKKIGVLNIVLELKIFLPLFLQLMSFIVLLNVKMSKKFRKS